MFLQISGIILWVGIVIFAMAKVVVKQRKITPTPTPAEYSQQDIVQALMQCGYSSLDREEILQAL